MEQNNEHSFFNKSQSEDKTRFDAKFNQNYDYVVNQPAELRFSIKTHIQKVIKSIADENLIFLLSILRIHVDEAEMGLVVLSHLHMLDVMKFIIKCRSPQMNFCLDLIVKLILKSIETTRTEIRKKCADFARLTLQSLLSHFSNAAFHKLTQYFIVPNAKNELVVFDLQIALEFIVLSMHKKFINAIAIHKDGNHLASFSMEEGRLIIWEIQYQGFFNSFFKKSDNKVYKEADINKYLRNYKSIFEESVQDWILVFQDLKEVQIIERNKNLKFVIKL